MTRSLMLVPLAGTLLVAPLAGCPADDPEPDPEPTPARDPEPDPWQPEGTEDRQAFPWSVQAGDPTEDGVILSVWSTEADPLTLRVVRADGDAGWSAVDVGVDEVALEDGRAQVELTGLEPDTAYSYTFVASDGERRSAAGRFRTAPGPGQRRVIRIGGTHGLRWNDFPFPCLRWAADERLDAFMLLGDTVYADGAETAPEYREYYAEVMSQDGFYAVSASTALLATWDDHEVANDWLAGDLVEGQYEEALQAFREAVPQRRGPDGGVWRLQRWGDDVDVIILDTRSDRIPGEGGQFLSPDQMQWLQDTLAGSTARFKLIVNSVPITDYSPLIGAISEADRWSGYPEDRDEILTFIADQAIPGVLWITGDFHAAAVTHVDPPGGVADDQWEVMVGYAGSPPNPMGEFYDEDEQFPVLMARWSYTTFDLDPGTGEVLVRFVDDDGEVYRTFTLQL